MVDPPSSQPPRTTIPVRQVPANPANPSERTPLFERVGGAPFFERLVDSFYSGVESDAELLALYPEPEDLGPAKDRLRLFLIQYWGGPTTYSDTRGHPRLRMRHFPYVIGEAERDAWLRHMLAAVAASEADPPEREELTGYFVMAANQLMNADMPRHSEPNR